MCGYFCDCFNKFWQNFLAKCDNFYRQLEQRSFEEIQQLYTVSKRHFQQPGMEQLLELLRAMSERFKYVISCRDKLDEDRKIASSACSQFILHEAKTESINMLVAYLFKIQPRSDHNPPLGRSLPPLLEQNEFSQLVSTLHDKITSEKNMSESDLFCQAVRKQEIQPDTGNLSDNLNGCNGNY